MQFYVLALLIVAAVVIALPTEDNYDFLKLTKASETVKELAQRKDTICDLPPPGGNAICNIYCIGRGKRGGRCNAQKICVCNEALLKDEVKEIN